LCFLTIIYLIMYSFFFFTSTLWMKIFSSAHICCSLQTEWICLWKGETQALFLWFKVTYYSNVVQAQVFDIQQHVLSHLCMTLTEFPPHHSSTLFCKCSWMMSNI
jgi:hypothetical protein